MRAFATLAAASVFVSQVLATPPPVHHDLADEVDKPTIIEASFDQLIDHNNPDLGTFPQRYWYNAAWWNGEGSPVRICYLISVTGTMRWIRLTAEIGHFLHSRRGERRRLSRLSDRDDHHGQDGRAEWWRGGSDGALVLPVPRRGCLLRLTGSIDRYWGESSPYQNLTSETLQYLTVEQAIADATYFAKTVDLPFDSNHSSNADNAVSSRPALQARSC